MKYMNNNLINIELLSNLAYGLVKNKFNRMSYKVLIKLTTLHYVFIDLSNDKLHQSHWRKSSLAKKPIR